MGRPKRPRIKPDGLPANVTGMLDRHGTYRLRFRKTGLRTHYFKSPYPSKAFWAEYDACLEGKQGEKQPIERTAPGTVHELMTRYFAVPSRLGPSETTQYKVRRILEQDFRLFTTPTGEVVGNKLVRDCDFEALEYIIGRKAKETPWQAKKLRSHLRHLFAFAKKIGMIDHNPVEETARVKTGKSKGYHTWTEAEIEQFVERHPAGTKANLAMMLMLWTFQRRSDAIRMAPAQIVQGRIRVEQKKGEHLGKAAIYIPIVRPLLDAITALPREPSLSDDTPFLLTEFGKPFTSNGFGNWFRKRCDEAGLPQCSAHGLRKGASRRGAELGLSNQQIKALTGHRNDDEVATYTAAADQIRMADDAMARIEAWHLANLRDEVAK